MWNIRGEKFVIFGACYSGEKAMLILEGLGAEVVAFCDSTPLKQGILIWDKEVLDYGAIRERFPDTKVIIAANSLPASYIIADFLEKQGLKREINFDILFEMNIKGLLPYYAITRGLRKVIKRVPIVINGDSVLTDLLQAFLHNHNIFNNVLIANENEELTELFRDQENHDPVYIPISHPVKRDIEYIKLYSGIGIKKYSFFFLYDFIYCTQLDDLSEPSAFEKDVQIKNAVLIVNSDLSGTSFIDSVLDGHREMDFLGNLAWESDIFYLVKKLKYNHSQDIAEDFSAFLPEYKMWAGEEWTSDDYEKYKLILKKYFHKGDEYTEKDILFGIYLAHYELIHGKPATGNLTLFIDPHPPLGLETCIGLITWLQKMGIEVTFLKMIRNPIVRLGARFNWNYNDCGRQKFNMRVFQNLLFSGMNLEYDYSPYGKVVRVRFEDLKLQPQKTLECLMKELNLSWDDSLCQTTMSGKLYAYKHSNNLAFSIGGYDISSVWKPYDEFLSPFDRLRFQVLFNGINYDWGYPYMDEAEQEEAENIVKNRFCEPWRCENYISFGGEEEKKEFRKQTQLFFDNVNRMKNDVETFGNLFKFGDYIKVK